MSRRSNAPSSLARLSRRYPDVMGRAEAQMIARHRQPADVSLYAGRCGRDNEVIVTRAAVAWKWMEAYPRWGGVCTEELHAAALRTGSESEGMGAFIIPSAKATELGARRWRAGARHDDSVQAASP